MTRQVPRLVCGDAGEHWVVSKERADDRVDDTGASCLVFAHARERRRLSEFPSGWRSLSNEALGALLPPA